MKRTKIVHNPEEPRVDITLSVYPAEGSDLMRLMDANKELQRKLVELQNRIYESECEVTNLAYKMLGRTLDR